MPSSIASIARGRPAWYRGLEVWALIAIASTLWVLVHTPGYYQWDFIVYHTAGQRFASGINPYGPIPGLPAYLHYVYPPITAALFAPFAGLGDTVAKAVWLVLKLVAFAATVVMWKRATGVRETPIPALFFFVFAMGSALLVDVASGNIATFEQCILWIGFTALLARRYWVFTVCTVLAAQFKLTPVFFLGLFLVIDERPRWAWFTGACALFAAVTGLNLLFLPRLSGVFLSSAASLEERGWADPAVLRAFQDLIETVRKLGLPIPAGSAYLLYGAVAVAVLTYTVRWRLARRGQAPDRVLIVLLSLATYALVMPRMKDYSYVALLPVAWYVLAQPRFERLSLLAVAVLIPRPLPQLVLPVPLQTIPYTYEPLITAALMWWMLLQQHAPSSGRADGALGAFAASLPPFRENARPAPA